MTTPDPNAVNRTMIRVTADDGAWTLLFYQFGMYDENGGYVYDQAGATQAWQAFQSFTATLVNPVVQVQLQDNRTLGDPAATVINGESHNRNVGQYLIDNGIISGG